MRVVEESEVVEEEMGRGQMGWKVWGEGENVLCS